MSEMSEQEKFIGAMLNLHNGLDGAIKGVEFDVQRVEEVTKKHNLPDHTLKFLNGVLSELRNRKLAT